MVFSLSFLLNSIANLWASSRERWISFRTGFERSSLMETEGLEEPAGFALLAVVKISSSCFAIEITGKSRL